MVTDAFPEFIITPSLVAIDDDGERRRFWGLS